MLKLKANELDIKVKMVCDFVLPTFGLQLVQNLVVENCIDSDFIDVSLVYFSNLHKKILNSYFSIQSYSISDRYCALNFREVLDEVIKKLGLLRFRQAQTIGEEWLNSFIFIFAGKTLGDCLSLSRKKLYNFLVD